MSSFSSLQEQFLAFLLDAKLHTYATQGDEATVTPLLPASQQLEWQAAPWLYRDIYFGMAYFAGQETVFYNGLPFWSMSYAGGVPPTITDLADIRPIYAFLRYALLQVSPLHPFRGPAQCVSGDYIYNDTFEGDLVAFSGHESIQLQRKRVYELYYSGGFLR